MAAKFSFTKADRLLKRAEYLQLSTVGLRMEEHSFIAIYAPGLYDRCRLGITVTKKIGGAATRNRIKRHIKECFRLNRHLLSGKWDINIIAKKEAANLTSAEIHGSLQTLFRRISSQTQL